MSPTKQDVDRETLHVIARARNRLREQGLTDAAWAIHGVLVALELHDHKRVKGVGGSARRWVMAEEQRARRKKRAGDVPPLDFLWDPDSRLRSLRLIHWNIDSLLSTIALPFPKGRRLPAELRELLLKNREHEKARDRDAKLRLPTAAEVRDHLAGKLKLPARLNGRELRLPTAAKIRAHRSTVLVEQLATRFLDGLAAHPNALEGLAASRRRPRKPELVARLSRKLGDPAAVSWARPVTAQNLLSQCLQACGVSARRAGNALAVIESAPRKLRTPS